MASSYPDSKRPEHDQGHHEPPCEDCDLRGVDDLTCESKGIADQAKYIADHAAALATRRAAYDTTRAAYTKARADVAADVAGIRKDLKQIREQLRCQLDRETLECLDEAWIEVSERLEQCGEPNTGCCVGDCDLDEECEGYKDDTIHELTARIARIDRHVTAAEACFDKLVTEPADLVTRVADLRKLVDALLTEIADPKTVDPKHAYATLRWLWHRFDDIWLGFFHAREFHDCLCRALTCSASGRRVLGILTGRLGVLTCRQDAEDTRCTWLRTHVVDEALEICAKKCRPERDDDHDKHDHDKHDHDKHGKYEPSEPDEPDEPEEPENPGYSSDSGGDEDEEEEGPPRRGRSSW